MATIFWNYEGVLMVDYAPDGRTIAGQYHTKELAEEVHLSEAAWRVDTRYPSLVHMARIVRAALHEC